ncbi:deoxyribodipyrimidine photo-lyase [Thiohalocapsa marina]|uniref:Deoxyribodipyrimidine photo-lyase n=1 Tax=Thiohalocapsa marina TaxID=424902 RepID=A0A5M8FPY5_9GAMM|nr:deoxyribodipyrimidine photo-lyase [Thiohalocapsa marina]KAA6186963.1 deoxyribodipyrimidine photo-lyase [Thiohalocapsa marina]
MPDTAILWLRRDLRLTDNPALSEALARCERVVPVYIHAPHEEAPWEPGAASCWWLHHSLSALAKDLAGLGSRLIIARGDSLATLRGLIGQTGATHCLWNRLYDPATIRRDTAVKQALRADGIACDSFNAAMLLEPWQVQTGAGAPYRVFTPYWRRCVGQLDQVGRPLPRPDALPPVAADIPSLGVDALGLLPRIRWDAGLDATWQPGEAGAAARLRAFLAGPVHGYREGRDLPAEHGTSMLSPHLHWGEIGPRQLLATIGGAQDGGANDRRDSEDDRAHYLRELGWRDFSLQLLYHFPQTTDAPLDPKFSSFPWRDDPQDALLRAWQQGRTGIPIVDAGMRELWHTGWMHNRVRMIVASLLTKNLRLSWQQGARWFWDTLVDADLASNTQGWQWSAGSGADAAPYFRIFNPVRQGERFDPKGRYVRRWCPELNRLPDKFIHQPWEAPTALLQPCGVRLGTDYPLPVVDLKGSRAEALAAYDQIKQGT